MPRADQIIQILDAQLERGAPSLVVLTVRHAASQEDWIVPIRVEAAADMVKRISDLLKGA